MPNCPNCESKDVVKNGFIHNGNQNHKCKACGRQFVEAPRQKIISEETKALIDKLLLEKIPLAGIARVCEVSETWLQDYVNRKYEAIPRQVNVSAKKRRLTITLALLHGFSRLVCLLFCLSYVVSSLDFGIT